MESLRTPDSCFGDLPGYDYPAHYRDDLARSPGLRMSYLDEGPPDAEHTYLCLHGQPTWNYLYRKMIPVFSASGARVVAPDFYGFGRSDKPVDDAVYTFAFHRDSLIDVITALDLRNITLVVQDWGGLLGLTLLVDPHVGPRITRLVVMNTALATGAPLGPGFDAWRTYATSTDDLDVAALLRRSEPSLSESEAAAYAAPFPDQRFKAGVRRFPRLVMTSPEMDGVQISRDAHRYLSTDWHGPSFMAIGERDPVLGPPVMTQLHTSIRHCSPPLLLPQAGHFVQEHGAEVARAAVDYFAHQ